MFDHVVSLPREIASLQRLVDQRQVKERPLSYCPDDRPSGRWLDQIGETNLQPNSPVDLI